MTLQPFTRAALFTDASVFDDVLYHSPDSKCPFTDAALPVGVMFLFGGSRLSCARQRAILAFSASALPDLKAVAACKANPINHGFGLTGFDLLGTRHRAGVCLAANVSVGSVKIFAASLAVQYSVASCSYLPLESCHG